MTILPTRTRRPLLSHNPIPDTIELTAEAFLSLEDEIKKSNLSEASRALVIKSLHFMTWLQNSLSHAKVSIKKLQSLFGILPRKGKKNKAANNADKQGNPDSCAEMSATNENNSVKQIEPQGKNKSPGRTPAEDYTGADVVTIKHQELNAGDLCPTGCGGKIYLLQPSAVIKIDGSSFARATLYKIDRLRCATCGDIFKPKFDLQKDKYTSLFTSHLIFNKYFMAMPFYRIEQYQKHVGIPISDTTQWKLVNAAYSKLELVFGGIEKHAASADLFHYDDTRVRILSVMQDNIENPDKKRTGQYTIVVIAERDNKTSTLFYSSTSHAGENMKALLKYRKDDAGKFIAMSDALGNNKIEHDDVIEANCLAHALVKFLDLEDISPYDLSRPIDDLRKIFEFDSDTEAMTDDQRLKYHQKHSVPLLDKLLIWLKQQIDDAIIEPSSHAAKAIRYCIKHWEKLTRFTVVAGCPVSNNSSERRIKLIIRLRKSSMFHKTEHGAKVAVTMLSLIQTALDVDHRAN